MRNRSFIQLAWASLFVIYLVIIAGSVVRMTGSGMGCPDWPKCFGYIIPPTEEDQVIFHPNTEYNKGQMIVQGDELWKAKEDFTSTNTLNAVNWEVHEKHDYAIFNPTHTWIEYINRLLGALSGLFMLALFIYSIVLLAKRRIGFPVVLLTLLGVFLLGFQAWLGRTVVDSHLAGAKITAHMFGALALIAVLLIIIRMIKKEDFFTLPPRVKRIAWVTFLLFLAQVFLGTEVREVTDHLLPNGQIKDIIHNTDFKIHRSFSWSVLISSIIMMVLARKKDSWHPAFSFLAICLLIEVSLGIALSYFGFPKPAQPLHLLIANIMFGCFVWLLLSKKIAH